MNIYLNIQLTSQSPDAQPISIGMVSECGRTFYAEFQNFDPNRCDDWVRDNIVARLKFPAKVWGKNIAQCIEGAPDSIFGAADTEAMKKLVWRWLAQFPSCQFVIDLGTWQWPWMLQLIAEWELKDNVVQYDEAGFPDLPKGFEPWKGKVKVGNPCISPSLSAYPIELNQMVAGYYNKSLQEAGEIDRVGGLGHNFGFTTEGNDALSRAKLIKSIYSRLWKH